MIVLLFMGSMLTVFVICFVVVLVSMVRSALAAQKEAQADKPEKKDKPVRKSWLKRRRSVQEIQPPDIDEIEQVEQKDENPYD